MAADTLATITSVCGASNAPGLLSKMWIAYEEDIDTIPAPTADTFDIATDITMVATKVFYLWDISRLEQKFDVNTEGDEDSNTKAIDLEVFIRALTSAKSRILSTNSNGCQLIVIVEDKNGQKWLLGRKGDGVLMTVKKQVNPKAGYVVSIKGSQPHLPYKYNGAIAV